MRKSFFSGLLRVSGKLLVLNSWILVAHDRYKPTNMEISATIKNSFNYNEVVVETNGNSKTLQVSSKSTGYGSSVNGGEFLLLAIATCFCNDIYREAAKQNMLVSDVTVVCTGEFGADGEPGTNFRYTVTVVSEASKAEIDDLIKHTDRVAEIHNTLRKGLDVALVQ